MEPKISIIMPFYNSESYIYNSVLSIIKQKYKNWELIAVNDGSNDLSENIVESFCDDRIRIFTKNNGGYCSAVNYGLEYITGDYFLMMGSDDILPKYALSIIADEVTTTKVDFASFIVKAHFLSSGSYKVDPSSDFNKYIHYKGRYSGFFKTHPYEASFFAIRDSGKVFKKSLLGDLRYFGKYGIDSDCYFSLLFAHKSLSFSVVPKCVYLWNIRDNSVSVRKKDPCVHFDRLQICILYIKKLLKMKKNEITPKDFEYSKVGYGILSMFCYTYRRFYVQHFFAIKKYCILFRIFLIRKKSLKYVFSKEFFNCTFIFICFLIRVIKIKVK